MISPPAPLKKPIVILANGEFPVHPVPRNLLDKSGTIICTDGAADKLIKYGLKPNVTIGDFDSTNLSERKTPGLWIPAKSQDRTDLQKALDWCIENNVSHVTILGAGGGREDHTLGNMHNLADYGNRMKLKMVTNHATITCVQGKNTIAADSGQAVSIVAIHPVNSITVSGLKYPIVDEKLLPSSRAICNETMNNEFSLNTTDAVWVFINHPD